MDIQDLLKDVTAYIRETGDHEGLIRCGVSDMAIVHTKCVSTKDSMISDPIVSLVLQGGKEANYGNRHVTYGAGDLLIVGQAMPILSSVVTADEDSPFVAIAVRVDMPVLRSLYGDIDATNWEGDQAYGMEAGKAEAEVIEAMARLFKLGRDPIEKQALGAATLREVYFRVLRSNHAGALRQMLNLDSKASRIAKAIAHIRKEYRGTIKADDLAAIAGMSASVFYENFKQATANSPLQYQKDLRLLEAHQMLQHARTPISEVASKVGYESPAQFSREFSRKFGGPPKAFVAAAQV